MSGQKDIDHVKPCDSKIEQAQLKISLLTPDNASNVDEKWSKNHHDLMRHCRVIAPQNSKKGKHSIFYKFYTAITL